MAVDITTLNTNSYTDQQASREQTQKLLDDGIEEIYYVSASAEAVGGFTLCEQVNAHCATWAGDSRTWAPTAGTFSVEIDWTVVMDLLVEQARNGVTEAQVFDATFENGGLKAQPLEGDAAADVPADLVTAFTAMTAELADGTIVLPESAAHPGLP